MGRGGADLVGWEMEDMGWGGDELNKLFGEGGKCKPVAP